MKDFDARRKERAERDRGFTLGGETFVMKSGVRPEVLAAYESIDASATPEDKLAQMDGMVLDFLEEEKGEAEKRWRKIRAIEDNPVTLQDIQDVIEWLIEAQTGRPTGQPSGSTAGPGATVTPLTGESSSRAGAGSTG